MLPLTDLKTATLYYQYVRFTRRHDWWRVINHVPCMKDCHWINRMISLYDITESAPENTVPKYRRNGARYGQTACVGGCVDRWSSSRGGGGMFKWWRHYSIFSTLTFSAFLIIFVTLSQTWIKILEFILLNEVIMLYISIKFIKCTSLSLTRAFIRVIKCGSERNYGR